MAGQGHEDADLAAKGPAGGNRTYPEDDSAGGGCSGGGGAMVGGGVVGAPAPSQAVSNAAAALAVHQFQP